MKFVNVRKLKEIIKDADDNALVILMNNIGEIELIGDSIKECKEISEGSLFFLDKDRKKIGEKVFVLQSDVYHYSKWIKSKEVIEILNEEGVL